MSDNKTLGSAITPEQYADLLDKLQVATAAWLDLNWIVENDDENRSASYWIEKAFISGAKAVKRSMEYAVTQREAREFKKNADNAINNFAKYCLMNPAVLRDKEKLLEVAATFNVPVAEVLSMFKKADAAASEAKAS